MDSTVRDFRNFTVESSHKFGVLINELDELIGAQMHECGIIAHRLTKNTSISKKS